MYSTNPRATTRVNPYYRLIIVGAGLVPAQFVPADEGFETLHLQEAQKLLAE